MATIFWIIAGIAILYIFLYGKSKTRAIATFGAKQQEAMPDLEFIEMKIKRITNRQNNTTSDAEDLAISCKPRLDNIKEILGGNDDTYLKISSSVVRMTQAMLVNVVKLDSLQPTLKSTIRDALEVANYLDSFDMDRDLRRQYNECKTSFQRIGELENWK